MALPLRASSIAAVPAAAAARVDGGDVAPHGVLQARDEGAILAQQALDLVQRGELGTAQPDRPGSGPGHLDDGSHHLAQCQRVGLSARIVRSRSMVSRVSVRKATASGRLSVDAVAARAISPTARLPCAFN